MKSNMNIPFFAHCRSNEAKVTPTVYVTKVVLQDCLDFIAVYLIKNLSVLRHFLSPVTYIRIQLQNMFELT